MKALIRLAYRQGILQGPNRNDLQELALLVLMSEEADEEIAVEEIHFRNMLIAYHLDRAKPYLDALDSQTPDQEGEFAEELPEEELENYEPYSAEESQAAVDMLRRFGVAVQ